MGWPGGVTGVAADFGTGPGGVSTSTDLGLDQNGNNVSPVTIPPKSQIDFWADKIIGALIHALAAVGGPPGMALAGAIAFVRAFAKYNPELVGGPPGGISESRGAETRRLRRVFTEFGSLPGAHGPWGRLPANQNTNIKVFGSNGLLTSHDYNIKNLKAFLALHRNRMHAPDVRSVGLFVDGFTSGSGNATSAGGSASEDGCTDQFYQDLRANLGLNSNRFQAVRQVCRSAGFRGVTCWGKTVNHRSSAGLRNALQPQNRDQLRTTADAVFDIVSLVPGTRPGTIAEWLARRSRARNINLPTLGPVIWAAIRLLLRRVPSDKRPAEIQKEVRRRHPGHPRPSG